MLQPEPTTPAAEKSPAPKGLLRRFVDDKSGAYLIITAIAMPVLVGAAAYGTEEGLLLYKQKQMQHAADSAATTAAVAVSAGVHDNGTAQANAVTASYGFTGNVNSTLVTVTSPPTTGRYTNNRSAIEVKISQPQRRLFSMLWGSPTYSVAARAVSLPQGQPCILALNRTASGSYSEQGSVSVSLVSCSVIDDSSNSGALNVGGSSRLSTSFVGVVGGISGQSGITATNGIVTGYRYVADPYASVNYPAYHGCDQHNYSTHATVTISPGVYCGGINLNSKASVTMQPGVYYLDGGSLSMTGQTSLSGTGVTLVFTSSSGSNYATATIAGGATLNITAPSTGALAGIAIFGDRSMPLGTTYNLTGGNTEAIGGAVYLAKGTVSWSGNATASQRCTQIVADKIQMVGDSGLEVDCSGYGTKAITTPAMLLE